jgi:hypothetical protein
LIRAAAVLVLGACVSVSPEYRCTPGSNAACVDEHGARGRCELSGNCSFPDPTCGDQGFRYDDSAHAGRTKICVLSTSGPSMTAAQEIGSTHILAFELTSPAQMFVFDTEVQGTDTHVSLHWFASTCPPSGSEQPATPQGCSNGIVTRISVTAPGTGPYCLVAADELTVPTGHVGLRVFPSTSGSAPGCATAW